MYVLDKKCEDHSVYPCKHQFFCIKVGFKGVYILCICFPDVFHAIFYCISDYGDR